ncbi:hypothetical protein [Pseudobacillus badius]|uniref:hypothetical protein n=1 Tax=Bacillus badius TaxID=1455 RepID=UPI0007B31C3D|nr:hypothetical protein [Bacillus badius]KZR57522.1 hypothetical protein A3781_19715 [Bacillus badius]
MINKDVKNTLITNVGNGWTCLEHNDAYTAYLKTFTINDKVVTAYMDNFSIAPLSLHSYDLSNLVVDEDWSNVIAKPIVTFGEYDFSSLKVCLPSDIYEDIYKTFTEFLQDWS